MANDYVPADFARQLERELMREIEARNGWWDHCRAADVERDALKAELAAHEAERKERK
jgi:hypothetical protein